MWYGKDIRPSKETTGEFDALMITTKKELPKSIEVMVKSIKESILYPFKK